MPPLRPMAVAAGYEEGSAMTEKRAGLSAMTLKYIAMATMLVDHMGYVLFPWILWLRCVGRIAFPIFAFQIAEGCIRTHDRRRYALRLLLFAVLTEGPFDLAFSGRPLKARSKGPSVSTANSSSRRAYRRLSWVRMQPSAI